MVRIEKSNEFGALVEADLQQFEFANGVALPEDYRSFLLSHNGGRPIPSSVKLGGPASTSSSDVNYINGIHDGERWASLPFQTEMCWDRIPSGFLPMAYDSGGNLYLLGVEPPYVGHVFFWDHENEANADLGELPGFDNMTFVAESFTGLLEALYEYVPPNESLEDRIIRTDDLAALVELLASGYDLEAVNGYGRTILERAAIYNRIPMFQYLYGQGAQLRDAMRYARQNKHAELMRVIEGLTEA